MLTWGVADIGVLTPCSSDRDHHRAPSVPDVLLAAIAETAALVVLHEDNDFDLIAEITGQVTQRLSG